MARHAREVVRQIWWDARKHPVLLAAVPLAIGGVVGFGIRANANVKSSTVAVLISSPAAERPFEFPIIERVEPRSLATEAAFLATRALRDAVDRRLGFGATVETTFDPAADVIRITARAKSLTVSRQIVDAYATIYIDHRRDQATHALDLVRSQAQDGLGRIDDEIAAFPISSSTTPGVVAQRQSLGQQRAALRARIDLINLEMTNQTGTATIVEKADQERSSTTPLLAGLAGMGGGLGVALGGLGIGRRLSRTIDTTSAAVAVAGSVPVLISVPHDRRLRSRPFELPAEESSTGENVRFLASLVERWNRGVIVVQITSSIHGEGTSTIAAQLAVALVERGQRTILVGSSIERWSTRRGVTIPDGLTLEELPTGGTDPIQQEMAILRSLYDFVIVDSPGVLASGTALRWSELVDLSLVVVRPEKVTTTQLSQTLSAVAAVREPARGIIFNDVLVDRRGIPLL